MVLKGGSWLYDGALLVMAEADNLAHPANIPLVSQEFWVQVNDYLLHICLATWVSLSVSILEFMF